jgi:hypothetical protein
MAKLLLGSVVGPQGPQGTPGVNGSQGPQGIPGPNEIAATTEVVGLTTGQLLYNNGGKVGSVEIVDNLLSIVPYKPLSANQGKVLKGLIDGNTSAIGQISDLVNDRKFYKSFIEINGSFTINTPIVDVVNAMEFNSIAVIGIGGINTVYPNTNGLLVIERGHSIWRNSIRYYTQEPGLTSQPMYQGYVANDTFKGWKGIAIVAAPIITEFTSGFLTGWSGVVRHVKDPITGAVRLDYALKKETTFPTAQSNEYVFTLPTDYRPSGYRYNSGAVTGGAWDAAISNATHFMRVATTGTIQLFTANPSADAWAKSIVGSIFY